MNDAFALHPRLAADTAPVAELPLCQVLLMNDARWAWLILVPRHPGMREIHDLTPTQRAALIEEAAAAARALETLFTPDKINVGALGNMVEQLHLHVVARHRTDPAWPGPVWGFGRAEPYAPGPLAATAARIADVLDYPA